MDKLGGDSRMIDVAPIAKDKLSEKGQKTFQQLMTRLIELIRKNVTVDRTLKDGDCFGE